MPEGVLVCTDATVLLGPMVWPSRTGEPEQGGLDARCSGRAWSRPLLVAPVLLGQLDPVSPDRRPLCPSYFMQAELPPPSRSGVVKRSRTPSPQGSQGGGNSACKKKCGQGSARAARGGVLSRPDERSRVKRRRWCTTRADPRRVRTEYPEDGCKAASTTGPPRSLTRNGRSRASAYRRPRPRGI